MHKLKQAIVFWALSKAPFSAVLSLYVGSNGKCLLAAVFAGHRVFSFHIAKQGTVKQSSIILFSLLNSLLWLSLAVPKQPAKCIWGSSTKHLLSSWYWSPCKSELIRFFCVCLFVWKIFRSLSAMRAKMGQQTYFHRRTGSVFNFNSCFTNAVLNLLIAGVLLKDCSISACKLWVLLTRWDASHTHHLHDVPELKLPAALIIFPGGWKKEREENKCVLWPSASVGTSAPRALRQGWGCSND